jgi:hypothetical protein
MMTYAENATVRQYRMSFGDGGGGGGEGGGGVLVGDNEQDESKKAKGAVKGGEGGGGRGLKNGRNNVGKGRVREKAEEEKDREGLHRKGRKEGKGEE